MSKVKVDNFNLETPPFDPMAGEEAIRARDRQIFSVICGTSGLRRGRPRPRLECRWAILQLLERRSAASHAIALELGLPRSTASYLLRELLEIGLVQQERNGKQVFYSLNPEGCDELKGVILRNLVYAGLTLADLERKGVVKTT